MLLLAQFASLTLTLQKSELRFTKIRIFDDFFLCLTKSYLLLFLYLAQIDPLKGKSSVERNVRAVLGSAIVLVLAVIDFEVSYEYPDGKKILRFTICSPLKALSLIAVRLLHARNS